MASYVCAPSSSSVRVSLKTNRLRILKSFHPDELLNLCRDVSTRANLEVWEEAELCVCGADRG